MPRTSEFNFQLVVDESDHPGSLTSVRFYPDGKRSLLVKRDAGTDDVAAGVTALLCPEIKDRSIVAQEHELKQAKRKWLEHIEEIRRNEDREPDYLGIINVLAVPGVLGTLGGVVVNILNPDLVAAYVGRRVDLGECFPAAIVCLLVLMATNSIVGRQREKRVEKFFVEANNTVKQNLLDTLSIKIEDEIGTY